MRNIGEAHERRGIASTGGSKRGRKLAAGPQGCGGRAELRSVQHSTAGSPARPPAAPRTCTLPPSAPGVALRPSTRNLQRASAMNLTALTISAWPAGGKRGQRVRPVPCCRSELARPGGEAGGHARPARPAACAPHPWRGGTRPPPGTPPGRRGRWLHPFGVGQARGAAPGWLMIERGHACLQRAVPRWQPGPKRTCASASAAPRPTLLHVVPKGLGGAEEGALVAALPQRLALVGLRVACGGRWGAAPRSA